MKMRAADLRPMQHSDASIARTAPTVIAPSISALTMNNPSEAHNTPPFMGTPDIRSCPRAKHPLVITLKRPSRQKIATHPGTVTPYPIRKICGGDSRQRHIGHVRAQRASTPVLED